MSTKEKRDNMFHFKVMMDVYLEKEVTDNKTIKKLKSEIGEALADIMHNNIDCALISWIVNL